MDSTGSILRRSVHTFLKNYQFYTFVAASLALPFSLSILISHDFLSSSSSPPLLPAINTRLQMLFEAACFPTYSRLFSLFTLKLSQTLSSSILTLPFTLSFLLITKAYVIESLHPQTPPSLPPRMPSITPLYSPILSTYISNSIIILAANSSIIFSLFLASTALGAFRSWSAYYLLFGSTVGAILFALVLAKALIVCNLALIVSGMEKHYDSFSAISRSLELMRGWSSTGLVLATTCNFALAAVEALFQYRVVRARNNANSSGYSPFYAACECLLIAYLYSIVIVVDTIASCVFYKSCRSSSSCMTDHMRYRRHYDCVIAEEEEDASHEDYTHSMK